MNTIDWIEGTAEAWEDGALGLDERFMSGTDRVSSDLIDEAMELQMISIRLEKSLIADFKALAQLEGLGYQPLMRQALTRFAEGEMRRHMRAAAEQRRTDEQEDRESGANGGADDDAQEASAA